MRRPVLALTSAFLVLLGAVGPVAAAAPTEVFRGTSDGLSADAFFSECIPDPVVEGAQLCTDISVFVFQGTEKFTGESATRGDRLCVNFQTYRITGDVFEGISNEAGCTTDAQITFAGDLATATASGTIQLETCVFGEETFVCTPTRTVDVSVTLTATGDLVSFKDQNRHVEVRDGVRCTFSDRQVGTRREPSGTATLTIDGVETALPVQYVAITDARSTFTQSCH